MPNSVIRWPDSATSSLVTLPSGPGSAPAQAPARRSRQLDAQFGDPLAGFGHQQLGHIALRAWLGTGDGPARAAQVEQPQRMGFGDDLTGSAHVVVRGWRGVEQLDEVVRGEPGRATRTAADREPLV